MSRGMILFTAATIVVIGFMVFFHESQGVLVRGLGNKTFTAGESKRAALARTTNIERKGRDNNTTYELPKAGDKSMETTKAGLQQEQTGREQFVVFDAWPTASTNCPNTPGELQLQDANSGQQSKNDDQNSPTSITPQSVLEDEFNNTSELYKSLANRLDKQNLSVVEYNKRIRKLQSEYDDKMQKMFRTRQKLDATQKLRKEGSIAPEEGKMVMWRLVLPDETLRAMNSNPENPGNKSPVSPTTRGMVTGIIYSEASPLAIIEGDIVGEGGSIRGVQVVKIHQDSVEFENAGFCWSQKVNDPPSTHWP